MKKLFTLVAVASMFTFVACGPSAEQKAAAEKKIADSTAAYANQVAAAEAQKAQAIQDSTNAFAAAQAAKQKAIDDSIAAAKDKKGGKKGKK